MEYEGDGWGNVALRPPKQAYAFRRLYDSDVLLCHYRSLVYTNPFGSPGTGQPTANLIISLPRVVILAALLILSALLRMPNALRALSKSELRHIVDRITPASNPSRNNTASNLLSRSARNPPIKKSSVVCPMDH